ncbi:MAG: aspartate--tRNA ligase, partial [Acholeplasmataceae bacterium]
MKITHNNGELRLSHINETVQLRGWVSKSRRMGGLIFIDLRDRFGITQLTLSQEHKDYPIAETLRSEFVIHIEGKVIERQSKNSTMPTGDIEVEVMALSIINTSKTPPIQISDQTDALEDTRLKYRYLDLRRPEMQKTLMMRSHITHAFRERLIHHGFYELETPILGKSTPEGARDFLVPSRLYEGAFYALPQSPQIFKQLYMVAGLEKYFQVAKCFRDEDLRADRQLEFTQLDIEASFVDQEEIIEMIEDVLKYTFKKVLDVDVKTPFRRIPYEEAIRSYGSDKPDVRFALTFKQLPEDIKALPSPLLEGSSSAYIVVSESLGRKQIDTL